MDYIRNILRITAPMSIGANYKYLIPIRSKAFFLLTFLLGISCTQEAVAQKFTATVNKTKVAVGEAFQVSFSLNAGGSGFKPPSFSDFDVYQGPNNYTSYQFTGTQQSVTNTISYVIAARKEGKYILGPASITVNGQRLESNPLTIEAVKGSSRQHHAQSQSATPAGSNSDDNLFARTAVRKTRVYVGEPVFVMQKIYTRLNLRGFQDIQYPTYNGFWSEEIPSPQQITLQPENLDGIVYNVAEMKKNLLIPQRSGSLEVSGASFDCIVRQRSNHQPRDLFEHFLGGGGYEDVLIKAKSRPVKIEVLPLPEENKPDDFSGAVGSYTFRAQLDKEKIKANEAVTLTLTISGKGNIRLIESLKPEFPDDIEAYDPKINDNISVSESGISGSKTFEYLLIPRQAGTYKISSVNFSYFNPEKKSYITLPSSEFMLQVEPADGNAPGAAPMVMKEDVKMLGTDIRYIKTNESSLREKEKFFFGTPGFIAGIGVPSLAYILFLMLKKRDERLNSDVLAVKRRKAGRMAQKRLAKASGFLKEQNKEAFFAEVLQALNGYLSDRLSIPFSALSKESALQALRVRSIEESLLQRLVAVLDACEFARYAPSAVQPDPRKLYDETEEIISKIETRIR